MKNKILVTLLITFFFQINSLLAQTTDLSYMVSGGKLNPLQAIMDIRHYTLALDVDTQQETFSGYVTIDLILSQPTDTLLFDLVHLLKVNKIVVNGKNCNFSQSKDFIFITSENKFQVGKQSVKIEYGGKPPVAIKPPWDGGFSWKKDGNGNPWVAINCQLEGGKIYFPCKDHPSDEPNEGVDLFITVPKPLVVAGPGLLESVKNKSKNEATYHWKTNYPISNYCIVFNVGKYKVVSRLYTTIEGNSVPMQFYVLEEDVAFADHVLDIRERDTKVLEKYFGEYPWIKEKIGIAEVPNSGMEHQTMITYGDKFKYRKVAGQDYSDNLLHEFGHEWFANKVTNKDWAHMWIQEGITTYSEALFFKEIAGESAYDSTMLKFRMKIQNKKPIVLGEEVNGTEAYSGDIYFKGAFFMHTLRHVLGDNLFFPTLKELATDKKYTYDNFVTTDDVEKLFSKNYGKDLKPLFDFYLRTINKLEIQVTQTNSDEYLVSAMNIPMPLSIDISTDSGKQKVIFNDNKPVKIRSKILPVIDPNGYYLKRVVFQ
jgi:aminopeptidase N